jgi:hypothetical protein
MSAVSATNSPLANSSTPPATVVVTTTSTTTASTTATTATSAISASNTSTTTTTVLQPANVNFKVRLDVPLMTSEQLYPTPSMKDNLPFDVEFDLRLTGCELIQTAGRLLKLPQV